MIGHRHESININPGILSRQFFPHRMDHPPSIVYPHLRIHNFPKQTLPILRADRDEICAGLGVIVPEQPYGSAMVFLTIELHIPRS